MNGRLQLIEQKLLNIDSAAFQNLCDTYLALREHSQFLSINRTGSQFGKQKTVPGTPDTFFRLPDGRLRYVEFTTKTDNIVAKIESDIDSCIDVSKTGVPIDQVFKIIIFYNSRLKPAEEVEITQYAQSRKLQIELIGLDWLALEILSKYLIIAKEILGIPLDTGQLLPLQNFIEEYNHKAGQLATPLDNVFLHRKLELNEINSVLSLTDLLVISGFPGVGKTKIALEAINYFLSENQEYSALAVSKKDQDISQDLKIHLQNDKNYILLVDDANRQLLNFRQILGIFKEVRKGNIKLIITVRDYALNDVLTECSEFDPYKIVLNKFTDDEIKEIVDSDSFEIWHHRYQKRIIEVADGNARLAVMAARLAHQKQEFFLLGEVSDLYDSYFQTFLKDFDLLGDKELIKTLGIVSFFFTINRRNKEFIDAILNLFEIDYHKFNEAIDELEKRELLEVQFEHARVAEQVMATYFFYKVFIKDQTLSFRTLLFNFFHDFKGRFTETIIPSNNSFGYENVLNKINPDLIEYLDSIRLEKNKVLEFFSLFWFYKQDEMLNYFHQQIKALSEPENPIYSSSFEEKKFGWNSDRVLEFLSNLFEHYSETFIPALELSFEYCRKTPNELPELVKVIREKLLFDDDDHRYDFKRQVKFLDVLVTNFEKRTPHYVEAFFAFAQTFLSHHYRITKGGRKHSITFYEYPLPFYSVTEDFRRKVWTTLFQSYKEYPAEVFYAIKNYKPGYRDAIPEILEFDLSLLIPFIKENLDVGCFKHIHFVQEFVAWLNRQKLTDRSYQSLKKKFTSKQYEYFRKLDWNRLRGKESYEFDDWREFEKLKENDIRIFFIYKTRNEFDDLFKTINEISGTKEIDDWGIIKSLDIIVDENFLRNQELGFELLENLLANYLKGLQVLYKVIHTIVNQSPQWALRLWNLLKNNKYEHQLYWQLAFFNSLPETQIDTFYRDELLEVVRSISIELHLYLEFLEKFTSIDNEIISKILGIVVDKNEKENIKIRLPFHFERYVDMPSISFDLLAKAYIQQENLDKHFDYKREGLMKMVRIKPDFLFEYIRLFYTETFSLKSDTNNDLSFVWDLKSFKTIVKKVANLIIKENHFSGILEHPLTIFFNNLNKERKIKAKAFILSFITKYNRDKRKMNAIFDVIRCSLNEIFEEAFLHYLNYNWSIEDFERISWNGSGGSYNGNTIIGEVRAKEWQRILELVSKSPKQMEMIPIKNLLIKRIESELKSAEEERKRKFINPDW